MVLEIQLIYNNSLKVHYSTTNFCILNVHFLSVMGAFFENIEVMALKQIPPFSIFYGNYTQIFKIILISCKKKTTCQQAALRMGLILGL